MKRSSQTFFAGALLASSLPAALNATTLNLGADYFARNVSIEERDKTIPNNEYTDSRLSAYLTTDLSKDVEATIRVQSITPWGLEGSTTPLATRYPNANGSPWVQNAFIRLPNIWKGRGILTIGRQPIKWGDGQVLSDDDLGFNAVRLNVKSPWRWLEADVDAFTAKIAEGLNSNAGDTDLSGVQLGVDRDTVRWEFLALFERNKNTNSYELGADTFSVAASNIKRDIYGVRAVTNLKDAYLKGAYYLQGGKVIRTPNNNDVKLGGSAFMIGLGGKQDTKKIGRFGALLEYAEATGDNPDSGEKDEAFRPTFAQRWSGLERSGYGRYFAATLSDAYSPMNPFGPASAGNDGLPDGASGIQTSHFGVELTPWAQWTFYVDYFQYKALKRPIGEKELGVEFDYSIEYRYTGLVTFRASINKFTPGKAYDELTRQDASNTQLEAEIKF